MSPAAMCQWVHDAPAWSCTCEQEIRTALIEAGYDPPPMPGTVWEDVGATYLPAGHRRLVKVLAVGPTINGWQVRLAAANDVPPGTEPMFGTRGFKWVDQLVNGFGPLLPPFVYRGTLED